MIYRKKIIFDYFSLIFKIHVLASFSFCVFYIFTLTNSWAEALGGAIHSESVPAGTLPHQEEWTKPPAEC